MKTIMNTSLSIKNLNEEVKLMGWISKKRNLGNLVFIDLRDRSGIIQLVIRPESKAYEISSTLRNEYVIECVGIIKERESKNKNILTGEIEVEVSTLNVLNTSNEIPFEISNETTALEDTRLKYRYLDLRRENLKNNMIMRHKITTSIRKHLDSCDFIEVETPILCKSTPEGARDYLVPSRVNKNKFYALPQSPQIFKQLLMISGFERYFQIAKCFRDEDLRADRQPEFTQLDMEMSFVNESDVRQVAEGVISTVFKDVINYEIPLPLKTMKYNDAMEMYGSDKPDIRFEMKLNNVTDIFNKSEFSVFKSIKQTKGIINALVLKNMADKYSRKDVDKLNEFVKTYGIPYLMTLKIEDELSGTLSSNVTEEELDGLKNELALEKNDLVLLACGTFKSVKSALGALRCKLGRELKLYDENDYKLLWVVDFPLFEYSEEDKRYYASHHPFTSPKDEDIEKISSDPGSCCAKAYDMIINGYEAGGGSIRIYNKDIQNKMFEALGMEQAEINDKFGYLIEAFKYGAPPHGGIAFGLDRLTMLLCKTENIRDVIAFPKTASASDLMSEAPNYVDKKQLEELYIESVK